MLFLLILIVADSWKKDAIHIFIWVCDSDKWIAPYGWLVHASHTIAFKTKIDYDIWIDRTQSFHSTCTYIYDRSMNCALCIRKWFNGIQYILLEKLRFSLCTICVFVLCLCISEWVKERERERLWMLRAIRNLADSQVSVFLLLLLLQLAPIINVFFFFLRCAGHIISSRL